MLKQSRRARGEREQRLHKGMGEGNKAGVGRSGHGLVLIVVVGVLDLRVGCLRHKGGLGTLSMSLAHCAPQTRRAHHSALPISAAKLALPTPRGRPPCSPWGRG